MLAKDILRCKGIYTFFELHGNRNTFIFIDLFFLLSLVFRRTTTKSLWKIIIGYHEKENKSWEIQWIQYEKQNVEWEFK